MISTETLEEILRQDRYEYNRYPKVMRYFLEGYFEVRETLLEKLIEISREERE